MVKRSEKCSVPTRASVLLCPYPLTPGPRLLPAQHCPSRCPVRGVRLLSFHCRTHPLPSRLCTELRRHCVALQLRCSAGAEPAHHASWTPDSFRTTVNGPTQCPLCVHQGGLGGLTLFVHAEVTRASLSPAPPLQRRRASAANCSGSWHSARGAGPHQ